MSSSSGGTNRAGQIQLTSKTKSSLSKNPASSSGFQIVGKNGKPIKNTPNQISPGFQQIIDNPPSLNLSSTAFNYDVLSPLTVNTSGPMVTDESINDNGRTNEHICSMASLPTVSTDDDISYNNKYINISFILKIISPTPY